MGRAASFVSRRQFLHATAAVAAGGCAVGGRRRVLARELSRAANDLRVADIRRTTVKVPYREVPQWAMDRELPHWRYTEIFQVRLQGGAEGIGETLLYYTWGVSDDEDVRRAAGQNAAHLMWDDSLGAGLQMALFDAVAKTLGVPVHVLLGHQVHETTPLSWWNIDMPPADMVAECREAYRQGYMSYKTKGRPWFDVWEQARQVAAAVPPEFKLDMDFNATLLDAERGIPILRDLEKYPQVDIYESPIPQSDVAGNRAICAATRVNIAIHYGTPSPVVSISQGVCDGFVVGGGASKLLQTGAVAATADMPFWLQLVGTGITAAFSLHFGGVLSHARWPAVNCHQLYQHDLLAEPIVVRGGMARVPERPGLGHDVDWDRVQQWRVDKPPRRPEPERMIVTTWPDGRRMYTANTGRVNFMLQPAMEGKMPFFERGVDSKLWPDDGSAAWRKWYQKAQSGPVMAD